MKTVIGTVKELQGEYFAKNDSDEIVKLKVGDKITSDMIVYGSDDNSDAENIKITMISLDEVLTLRGVEKQTFDLSLVDDNSIDDFISPESLNKVFLSKIYEEDISPVDVKDVDETFNEETEAGEEKVVGQSTDDVFLARNGEFVDIVSNLRSANFTSEDSIQTENQAFVNQVIDTTVLPVITPTISINDQSVNEDAGTITFTVTLSNPSASVVSVDYATTSGTATAGTDVENGAGTLTFAAGETSKTITLNVTNDDIYEISENFTVDLTAPVNATLSDAQGLGTINDEGSTPTTPNDKLGDAPHMSIGDVTVEEGSDAIFTVTVGAAEVPYSVTFNTTTNGSAEAGDITAPIVVKAGTTIIPQNSDGSYTVPANTTTLSVSVPTVDDVLDEGNETFELNGKTEFMTSNVMGTGTITDNDDSPVSSTINPRTDLDNDVVMFDVSSNFTDTDTLTYSATGLPAGLTIDPVTGVISGTIDNSASQGGTSGIYSVTVTATDGANSPTSQTFDWSVNNPGPVAVDDTASVAEDAALNVSSVNGLIQSNDTDSDGDALSIIAIRTGGETGTGTSGSVANALVGTYGTLTLQGDGSYTYVADQAAANALAVGVVVSDTFTYTLSDGEGGVDTAELVINVTGTNDAPIAQNSIMTMNEDTIYTYSLSDFNSSDVDSGDTLTAIRIDSLPVLGDLYYNGVLVTTTDLEISATNVGLLTFKPDLHDSGSDQYIDDIGNSTSVGEQSASYGQFNFSVSDGTDWSASSGTMTIDVNAVADAPTLSVGATNLVTELITVDSVNLTGAGFSVNAYNAYDSSSTNNTSNTLGSLGTISTHGTYGSSSVNGFGVAGAASGDDDEIGYDDALGTSETIVVSFDDTVSSVDMALSWNHSGENVEIAFYNNGVLIEALQTGGGTDGNDAAVTYKPSTSALFDEIRIYPPDSGDDFLIHSISFAKETPSTTDAVIGEGEDITLNITSSLVDTDNSESLTLEIKDIPAGAIISDGTNVFTAGIGATTANITGWNLDTLTFNMPNIDVNTVTYTLNVVATSTEYSNGDSAATTLPINVTVVDPNYTSLENDVAQVEEADIANVGTNGTVTIETTSGNLFENDYIGNNVTLSNVTITNGTTSISNGMITVETIDGNTLVVNASTGDYTYTLTNAVTHSVAGHDSVVENFTYSMSGTNGVTTDANLAVTIVDDVPTATPQAVSIVVEPLTTNVIFVLDVSGSMNSSELQLEADARDYAISKYNDIGDVNVMQVQFNNGVTNSGWVNSNQIEGTSLSGGGNTNYEIALNSVMDNYDTNRPVADQTIVYFISDGDITSGSETNWNSSWGTFIAQDSITKLFTFGVGGVGSDLTNVALPNEDLKSPDPIAVTDINDLATEVGKTVDLYTEGNLTQATNGDTIIDFGADGGHITSITIGTNTVAYDAANIVQTVVGTHGEFEINFETGTYRYMPTDFSDYTEQIQASVVDKDNDNLNTILLNINISIDGSLKVVEATLSEDYNSNNEGWTNASTESNALFIDNGQTASKTYNVNPEETVHFYFDATTQSSWGSSDTIRITDANGDTLYTHSDDYSGSISFEAKADTAGDITLKIEVDTNNFYEELYLDNMVMTRELPISDLLDDTTHTFTMSDEMKIDFGDIANQIENLQTIDMTSSKAQEVNLSLSDVLDMTSSNGQVLTIEGNSEDSLNIDTTDWTQNSAVDNGSNTTYEYSKGSDSITLTVDDQIDTTGM